MPESKRHPARRPERRPSKAGHRNPARANAPAPARAQAPGFRGWLESWSVGPLTFLMTLPTFLPPMLLGLLLVGGLWFKSAWAALLLLVVGLFLLWLTALSWPRANTQGKLLRMLAVFIVFGSVVLKALGRI